MTPAELRVLDGGAGKGKDPYEKRHKVLLWTCMILGIAAAGVAFVYKVAEFLFTLNAKEVQGFADVPVTVYFVVAAGWLCLLVWCFLTGKFTQMENSKHEMIEKEEEYERQGI